MDLDDKNFAPNDIVKVSVREATVTWTSILDLPNLLTQLQGHRSRLLLASKVPFQLNNDTSNIRITEYLLNLAK